MCIYKNSVCNLRKKTYLRKENSFFSEKAGFQNYLIQWEYIFKFRKFGLNLPNCSQ